MSQLPPSSNNSRLKQKILSFLKKLGICFLHSLLLIVLAVVALNSDYNFSGEESQLEAQQSLRNLLRKRKDYVHQFCFIDISRSRSVVERADSSGTVLISKRDELLTWFKRINSQEPKYKFILCDLTFKNKQHGDNILFNEFQKTERLIMPNDPTNGIGPDIDYNNVVFASAGYKLSSGIWASSHLLKYQYINDNNQTTIPLAMFEQEFSEKGQKKFGLLWLGNKAYFNNQAIEFRIGKDDLQDHGNSLIFPIRTINKLLKLKPKEVYNEFFAGKYVVIGDFEFDVHETFQGSVPGSVLLSNFFLSLREGENELSYSWILYMAVTFTSLSFLLFYPGEKLRELKKQVRKKVLGLLLAEYLSFVFLISILSFYSYYQFGKDIDIILISFYLALVGFLTEVFQTDND